MLAQKVLIREKLKKLMTKSKVMIIRFLVVFFQPKMFKSGFL